MDKAAVRVVRIFTLKALLARRARHLRACSGHGQSARSCYLRGRQRIASAPGASHGYRPRLAPKPSAQRLQAVTLNPKLFERNFEGNVVERGQGDVKRGLAIKQYQE